MIDEEVIHAAKPRSTTPAAARTVSPEHAEEGEEGSNHHHHHYYKNNKKKWSSKFATGLYPFVTFIYSLSGYSANKCVNIFSVSGSRWKHRQPAVGSIFRCACVRTCRRPRAVNGGKLHGGVWLQVAAASL